MTSGVLYMIFSIVKLINIEHEKIDFYAHFSTNFSTENYEISYFVKEFHFISISNKKIKENDCKQVSLVSAVVRFGCVFASLCLTAFCAAIANLIMTIFNRNECN